MTTTFRHRYALPIIGISLVLAACSGSGAPAATVGPSAAGGGASSGAVTATRQPATSASPAAVVQPPGAGFADPCHYLTQDEVSAALGQVVGPGKKVLTLQDCIWAAADFTASADLTLSSWDSITAAAHAGTSAPTPVPGIGDEAFTALQGSLYVRKGDQGFLLLITSPLVDHAGDSGIAIAKTLAAKILARM